MDFDSRRAMTPGQCFLLARVIPCVLIILGIVLVLFTLRSMRLGSQSEAWPVAQGIIQGDGTYYQFPAEGAEHYGDRIDFDNREQGALPGSDGTAVMVHYMPGNPDMCVLNTGRRTESWLLAVELSLSAGIGLVFALAGPWAMRRGVAFTSERIESGCVFFVVVLAVAGAGVFVLYHGAREAHSGAKVLQWPAAQGIIEDSSLEALDGRFRANVRYSFTVDGKAYEGKNVAVRNYWQDHPAGPGAIINTYQKGASVTVHFLKEDPQQCFLEGGISANARRAIALGAGIIGLAAVIVILSVFKEQLARMDPVISKI